MLVSAHPIRNIQNTLSPSASASTYSAHSSSHTNILMSIMGKQPSLGSSHGMRRGSTSSPQNEPAGIAKRAHRPSIRLPYTNRRAAPPPIKDEDATFYLAPPSDDAVFNPTRTVVYDSPVISLPPPPRQRRNTFSSLSKSGVPRKPSPSILVPEIALAPDSESRSKIVAGILLHRVHAVGKPIRRKIVLDHHEGRKEYVRSSLSAVITVEC